ncbi:VOC family protein [Rhodoligotrophos defluvii]|uniref:VOC family protein n=1 Tax=Rhodoligotrophos defluvii TaxID=2561934 RepID=UPI0010C9BC63|nr:VOC family protein [Rhodoligotrophos defluvii]
MIRQKITPVLWFDNNAEAAVNFYIALFENSRITGITRYGDAAPGPKGDVMSIGFELAGQTFAAINGGPSFTFSPAVSFFIHCDTQAEIDHFWDKLLPGGAPQQCGWITDRFGLVWQVNYTGVIEMLQDPDPVRADRVMQAMMPMTKIEIAKLKAAYEGA